MKRQATDMTGGQLNTPLNARQGNPHAVNAEPWGKNITQTFFPHPAIAQITDVPRIAARGRPGRAAARGARVQAARMSPRTSVTQAMSDGADIGQTRLNGPPYDTK